MDDAYSAMRPAPADQPTVGNRDQCVQHLTSIRRVLIGDLLEWATFRPVDSAHLLLQTLREAAAIDGQVKSDTYHLKGDIFRWIQVIYAVVLASGGRIRTATGSTNPLTSREVDLRSRQVSALTSVSKLLVRFSRNEIDLRISEGVVQLKERIDDLLGIEFIQNIARASGDIEGYRLIDPDVSDVQTDVLGFALSDLDHKLPSRGISLGSSGFVTVDHGKLTPRLDALIRRVRLSEEILRYSEYPDFFDLSPRRSTPRADAEMVEASSEMLWSLYFPFLPVDDSSDVERGSVTARTLIVGPSIAAAGGRSHMLDLLRRKSADVDPMINSRVNSKIQKYHSDFEALVANRAARASMQTKHSIGRVRGVKLTCGEIDVACLGRLADGENLFILVVEVKNTDRPMHKSGGMDQVRAAIVGAAKQAQTKAAWVEAHRQRVLLEVFNCSQDQPGSIPVFPLIVTREPIPLGWSYPVPALTFSEFGAECEVMQQSDDFGAWRPDIRRVAQSG